MTIIYFILLFFLLLIIYFYKGLPDKNVEKYFTTNKNICKILKTVNYDYNNLDIKLRNIDESDMYDYYCKNLLNITNTDKQKLFSLINKTKETIDNKYYFLFDNILFLKWKNHIDNGYPQTNKNIICLSETFINNINTSDFNNFKYYGSVLIHELIHIWQKKNPKVFEKLYELWNFKKIKNLINDDKLKSLTRFNPDGISDYWVLKGNKQILLASIYKDNSVDISDVNYIGYYIENNKIDYSKYDYLENIKEYTDMFGNINGNHYDLHELSASLLTKYIFKFDHTNIDKNSKAYNKISEWLPINLSYFERKQFSQNGEDGITEKLIELIYNGNNNNKFFVEFGVENGLECNTRILREKYKWKGLQMDGSYENSEINLRKEWISKENIIGLFKKYNVPKNINLLSVDIDFNDFYCLKEILSVYTCDIIICNIILHIYHIWIKLYVMIKMDVGI